MIGGRSNRCRALARLWVVCALLAVPAAARAEEAGEDSSATVPEGFSYGVEATSSFHHVNTAYFGTDWGIPGAHDDRSFTWGEGFTRLRVNYGGPQGVWASVGGVVMATSSKDYFGVDGTGDGRLDQLLVGASDIGGSGLSVVVGRQDLQVGDGFLIGDGYRDSKAALWNIPLNFYDAARADWTKGPWHALGLVARLSPSYAIDGALPKGVEWGGEAGWSASEKNNLALGFFQRNDDGETNLDASALSLRGAAGAKGFTLAGEVVKEGGTQGLVDLKGYGGHLGLTYELERPWSPYAEVEYLLFTGDDPSTPENEAYYPWEYRWTDWSKWYVADLVASTLLINSDSRIWKLEIGAQPREATGLRLLLHHIDLDTGSSYGGIPEGVGRGFAEEADVVVDQSLNDHWSAWVMGGYVRPLDAGKVLVGTAHSGQLFASITYKFDGVFGGGKD